ncbi:MAG TPA: tetratricopeptide repeat protein [Candidatus Gastranaerophilaceae bacterium]|nr:tetratricopeptide repeat protein [Candidatus Gastranaerophilaceae bacterium]
MKRFKKIFILLLFFLLNICNYAFSQNNYSNAAIQIYNSGVNFHKQHNFDLAEQKYFQVLKIQPNFIEAKNNLALLYYNKAVNNLSSSNYTDSIVYAQKALSYGYKPLECYNIIANCYMQMKDYENLILIGNKLDTLSPNDEFILNYLALAYMNTNQNEKARDIYQKILLINPDDKAAQQNIKYINYCHSQKVLNNSINNLPTVAHAPASLYRLIKPSAGITQGTVDKMKYILDLIWSEPNGQILLQEFLNKKIPIKISQGTVTANAMLQNKKNTLLLYGFIPVFSYDTSSISVNIAFNYISDFFNPNIDSGHRIYDLQVFVHEFGHAFMLCKNSGHRDSIEEELGVSMIGFNSAYKIIIGKGLTKEQTEEYSLNVLQSLLSDEHRNLPVYNGFVSEIQRYGIVMPYPEIYSNLPAMYKKLLCEEKISPVPNFYVYNR